jgi:methionyl-tRNA formyltransferase
MMHEFLSDAPKLHIVISGQKRFAEDILRLCVRQGHKVVAVCCPPDDRSVGALALRWSIPIIPAGSLNADNMPEGVDLGIAAHSFDYVGKRTRYKARLGWIGYHPSLLPLHRGKSSVVWTLKMRDPRCGGTWYWLNAGVDRGDVAAQDWAFVDPALWLTPSKSARSLWRETLAPMGERLLELLLPVIASGGRPATPQDERFASFEPSCDVADIYRPDLLMLGAGVTEV